MSFVERKQGAGRSHTYRSVEKQYLATFMPWRSLVRIQSLLPADGLFPSDLRVAENLRKNENALLIRESGSVGNCTFIRYLGASI